MGSLRDKIYGDLCKASGFSDLRWKHNSADNGLLFFKKDSRRFCIDFERVSDNYFYYDWINDYWTILPFKPKSYIENIEDILDLLIPLLMKYDNDEMAPIYQGLAKELNLRDEYDDELTADEAAEELVNLYFLKNPNENDEKGVARSVLQNLFFYYLYCGGFGKIDQEKKIVDRERHKRRYIQGKEKERLNKKRHKRKK